MSYMRSWRMDPNPKSSQLLMSQDIRNAQMCDPIISRVLELKKKQLHFRHKAKLKEPEAVRQLLRG